MFNLTFKNNTRFKCVIVCPNIKIFQLVISFYLHKLFLSILISPSYIIIIIIVIIIVIIIIIIICYFG